MRSRKGRAGARPFRPLGLLLLVLVAASAAGCGGDARGTKAAATSTHRTASVPIVLRVGVVGALQLDVPGVGVRRGTLAAVADEQLVLVDAGAASADVVAAVARAHPLSHFALVGASAQAQHVPNLAGIVLEQAKAAYLAGFTAGLAAADEDRAAARVAWVGPEEGALAAAFGRGVHAAAPGVAVLHQYSQSVPARCKEAALTALDRGATVVFAHGGLCAAAAAAGAHEQNRAALRLGDFLLPGVAAAIVVREAAGGVFRGGEDVVFGPATGAIGIARLDPRISFSAAAKARAAADQLAGSVARSG